MESTDLVPLFPFIAVMGSLLLFDHSGGRKSHAGAWDQTFFFHIHVFIFLYTISVGMEKQTATRRILLKDREVEAVPAPSVLLQFIFVCKKVKVLPEQGGNIAREAKQQSSVQRDPLELPTLSHAAAINTPRPLAV